MSFAVAGLKSGMEIENAECINVSFPNFWKFYNLLQKFAKRVSVEVKLAKNYGFCFGVKRAIELAEKNQMV